MAKLKMKEAIAGTVLGILMVFLPIITDAYALVSILYLVVMIIGLFRFLLFWDANSVMQSPEIQPEQRSADIPEFKQAVEAEERRIYYPDGSELEARRIRYWQ